MIEEITPLAAERLEFYGQPLAVGDRVTHCPDIVCGRCYSCTHVQGYVWCDRSSCYGNSFSATVAPHLMGGWAEYLYLRPDTFVYKVPSGLSPRVAVLAEVMACTASLDKLKEFSSYALEGFNSGDTVMVIGAGPLGLLHIAKADMMGAGQIIASDLSGYRLDWARRCGADETLDVTATTSAERIERVRELTGGRGADVVLHMANTPASFVEGIEMLKRGGMMLEMGNFADTGETSPQRAPARLQQEHPADRADQPPEHRVRPGLAAAGALRRPLPVRRDGEPRVRPGRRRDGDADEHEPGQHEGRDRPRPGLSCRTGRYADAPSPTGH